MYHDFGYFYPFPSKLYHIEDCKTPVTKKNFTSAYKWKNPITKFTDNFAFEIIIEVLAELKKEIESKNSIIKALNQKITKFNNDYNKKLVEIKQNSNEYINQIQEQVEQLIIERDELLRKNEKTMFFSKNL